MPSLVMQHLASYGPDHCEPLGYEQASAYAQRLASSQYENFSVLSRLVPRELRPHFAHVYAFCRWADDLGDETGDAGQSRELLGWWRDELDRCYAKEPRHPVFVALHRTVEAYEIPRKPFDDLIDAFLQDQQVRRYETWGQLLDYCTRSANPVGRLVLYLAGYRDERRQALSDATCTALQLTNFWQDVRRDVLERDRIYIPAEVASEQGLSLEQLAGAIRADAADGETACVPCGGTRQPGAGVRAVRPGVHATLAEVVRRTWPLFAEGRSLWPLVDGRVRPAIELFTLGGESVLQKIERGGYDTHIRRPRLGRGEKALLVFRGFARQLLSGRGGAGSASLW